MLYFTGHYPIVLDGKHRLTIPARIRSILKSRKEGNGFFITPGQPRNRLWIYTEKRFDELSSRAGSALAPPPDQLYFDQIMFPWSIHAEADAQGRLVVPEEMLRRAGLAKELVLCGVRDHLELRGREDWERSAIPDWESYPEAQRRAEEYYGVQGGKPA